MNRAVKSLSVLFVLAVGAGVPTAVATHLQPNPNPPFSRVYFTPTSGRVGYHFVSEPNLHHDDLPSGYASGECKFKSDTSSHVSFGKLPPGIIFDTTGSMRTLLNGTPRQPGVWDFTVVLNGLGCTAGHDQTKYTRQLSVRIQIEP